MSGAGASGGDTASEKSSPSKLDNPFQAHAGHKPPNRFFGRMLSQAGQRRASFMDGMAEFPDFSVIRRRKFLNFAQIGAVVRQHLLEMRHFLINLVRRRNG